MNDFNDLEHPVNRVASFADWDAVRDVFRRRRPWPTPRPAGAALLDRLAVPPSPLDRLHGAGFLGEAVDSASLWTTLFNHAGTDLFCPFLDSRMLRFALNLPPAVRYRFRRPKDLLKRALERLAPAELARRRKLGFGQPIFEWLAPGGQLRPLVERIGAHDFVPPGGAGAGQGEAELVPLQPALLRPVAQAVHRALAAVPGMERGRAARPGDPARAG